MQQHEFLVRSGKRLERLIHDHGFENERSQLRAKALLHRLHSGISAPIPQFTFSETRLWRNCQLILNGAVRSIVAGSFETDTARQAARMAAETAEYIASVSDRVDRQQALIAASLLYHLAGYEANGICLARSIQASTTPDDPDGFFVSGIASFLLREFRWMRGQTDSALADLRQHENKVIEAIDEGRSTADAVLALAANIGIQRALNEIASFGLDGDDNRFLIALDEIREVLRLFSETGDVERSIIATSLNAAIITLHDRSTWACLRALGIADNPTWTEYLQVLALGDSRNSHARSAVEFWPSQRAALDSGLLGGERGFAVQMPTSAGKTRVAELAIIDSLVRFPNSRCVYVAPFRALAQEIEQSLGRTIGQIGYHVSTVLGSFETDEFENYLLQDTQVLITTPEKLDLLFRWQPDYFDKVSLIVLDEGHIVDDNSRGARYELLLTKVKRRCHERNLRFLFVSAVMPEENSRQFAAWLAGDRGRLIKTPWRPARLLLGKFTWQGSQGRVTYVEPAENDQSFPFVPYLIECKEMVDFTPKRKQRKIVLFPDPAHKGQTAAELAFHFADQGQILIFCSQTTNVRSTAQALLDGLRLREQSGFAVPQSLEANQSCATLDLAREWLDEEHILVRALSRGIGIHYRPLPEVVRNAVEDDFRAGHIRVLISTNTLAQGVNLPISTAIVHSVARWDENKADPDATKVRDYWNICGRAGRAGVETQGQILHIIHPERDLKKRKNRKYWGRNRNDLRLFNIYANQGNVEPVESRLFDLLRELAAERISDDELRSRLDADLLAVLVEESVDSPNRGDIEAILDDSLVKIQAVDAGEDLDPLVHGMTAVAQFVFDRVPDKEKRRVFSTTGLGLDSCEALVQAIHSTQEELENAIGVGDVVSFVRLAYGACSTLREIQPQYSPPSDIDVNQLLLEWLSGDPIPDLWAKHIAAIDDRARAIEHLSRFMEDLFVYHLPWGFNAFLRVAEYVLEKNVQSFPMTVRYVANMIKYGLPDHVACWARSLRIPTRASALMLARGYREDNGDESDFKGFMKWLASLGAEDLSNRFLIRGYELDRTMAYLNLLWIPSDDQTEVTDVGSRTFTFEVRGLQYEGRREQARGITLHDAVTLEREPQNQYDPNAIKVYRGDRVIGYVAREVARELSREMDLGAKVTSQVIDAVTSTPDIGPDRIIVSAVLA